MWYHRSNQLLGLKQILLIKIKFNHQHFRVYGYTGVPLKLKSRRFCGIYLYPKNYRSGISWVHICTIKKCKNCLYIYFLNDI